MSESDSTASLDQSIAAVSQFFVGGRSVLETLARVSELATAAVPAARYAGITMLKDGRAQTGVFTDPDVPEIDQAQYDAGAGPCLEAWRTGEIVRIDSTETDTRWPEFCAACRSHGIFSTLSLPLEVDGARNGALNLYAEHHDGFNAEQLATARLFGAQAAVVLANADAYWTARARSEQLEQALDSRAEIEQAKGIIIGALRCTPDEAFDTLARQSQQQNRKLRDVAAEVVRNASRRP